MTGLHQLGNATIGSHNPATLTILDNDVVLTTAVSGNGTVGLNPDQPTYTLGDVVTLTATADPDWNFSGWSGDLSGSTTPVTITMTGNKNVTATFTQDEYTLAITTIGSGWVITNPAQATYTYGEVVTLTALANAGWSFAGWSGDLSGSTTPVTITMTGNQVVSATFTENVITLDFIKTALDVDGAPLLVTDTIRYTLQVTNTGPYTAANVVVDRHPAPEYDAREHVHFPGGRFRLQPAGLECR